MYTHVLCYGFLHHLLGPFLFFFFLSLAIEYALFYTFPSIVVTTPKLGIKLLGFLYLLGSWQDPAERRWIFLPDLDSLRKAQLYVSCEGRKEAL